MSKKSKEEKMALNVQSMKNEALLKEFIKSVHPWGCDRPNEITQEFLILEQAILSRMKK